MTNGSGQKYAADPSRRVTLGRGRGQTGLPRSSQQNPKSNASPSVEIAINTAAECPRSSHIDAPWPTSCRGGGYAAESRTLRPERSPVARSREGKTALRSIGGRCVRCRWTTIDGVAFLLRRTKRTASAMAYYEAAALNITNYRGLISKTTISADYYTHRIPTNASLS